MSRKLLTNEEMLHITSSWIAPQSPANIALLSVPELAAKAQLIAKVHTTLAVAAQPSSNPRIAKIIVEQSKLDLRHDSIIRGVFGLCTSTAELLGGDEGAELIALRDLLIPDGLPSMQKTYRAEAGQAQQLADRITPEIETKAKAIRVGPHPQKSLFVYLNEWITVGKRIGTLEDEKTQLLAEQSSAAAGTALVQARNRWIRVVNAVIADADLAEIDAATDLALFGALRDAEKKAENRSRPAPTDTQTTPDPVPTDSPSQP